MRFDELNESNYLLFAIKFYDNPQALTRDDFESDLKRIRYVKRLLKRYKNTGELKVHLILNHLIVNPNLNAIEAASQLNLIQENNQELLIQWVDEVIEAMPDKVKEYKSGKKGLIGLFAGEVKKKSKGKADMQSVNQILSEKLK